MLIRISVLLLLALSFRVQLEWIVAGVGATRIGPKDDVIRVKHVDSESAERLVELLRSRGIGKVRLHNADFAVLQALGSRPGMETPIEVIVGIQNDEIVDLAVSPVAAQSWIASNVVPHFPATNIIAIAVGSEDLTSPDAHHRHHQSTGSQSTFIPFLVPALRNLHAALSEVGLEKRIKVSSPQSARVLSKYFAPFSVEFNGGVITESSVNQFLEFLVSSESYVMLNLYRHDLEHDGVVGMKEQEPEKNFGSGDEMGDPQSGLHYSSIIYRLMDALSAAMAALGHDQPTVVAMIEMEWSRSSSSNRLRTEHLSGRGVGGGVAVDIDSKFVEDFLSASPKIEDNGGVSRVEGFFSRRFLMDSLKTKQQQQQDGSGKRRKLANKSWCVAKQDASTNSLQSSLDWACGTGGGVDCQPIQVGQSCFLPNTIVAHASYAFNSYYQKESWSTGSCDFGGIAEVTTSDPSTASCLYPSSTSANGTPSTPTGTILPSLAAPSRLHWDGRRVVFMSIMLVFVIKRILTGFEL